MKYTILILLVLLSCENGKKEDDTKMMVSQEETKLKEQVSAYPDSLLIRETLIQHYTDNGNFEAAIAETENGIKRDSSNPRLYYIKANLLFENGDTLKAISSLEKGISIYPELSYLISLGRTYAQTKNKKALDLADLLKKAYNMEALDESFFIKGLYHNFNNNKLTAIPYFDSALALNFHFMDAYREKGIALYDLGKYNESFGVLDKAVKLQNNFDEGYYYRGVTLEKLNRKDEAIESYQLALRYDPQYVEAKDALNRLTK